MVDSVKAQVSKQNPTDLIPVKGLKVQPYVIAMLWLYPMRE
jgi:hypothetical protein